MILVVGLGNPGERYEQTRHNVGFMVVDRLCQRAGTDGWQSRFEGLFTQISICGQRLGVLKPQTFVNLSGRSVRRALSFFKLVPDSLLVVHDELDLPFMALRLKLGGGEAGHRGLASVTGELGTSGYGRLRFGIGRPPADYPGTMADYVLEAFTPTEREALPTGLDRAVEAITLVAQGGMAAAMNVVNRRGCEERQPPSTVFEEKQ